jgi:hypothetical protein
MKIWVYRSIHHCKEKRSKNDEYSEQWICTFERIGQKQPAGAFASGIVAADTLLAHLNFQLQP